MGFVTNPIYLLACLRLSLVLTCSSPPECVASVVQGWEVRVDPASGERYFVNHRSRTTTWNGETAG